MKFARLLFGIAIFICIVGANTDDSPEDSGHQKLSLSLLVIAVSLFFSLILVFCLSKFKVLYLPSSVLTILIGVLVGVIAHYGKFHTMAISAFSFQPESFFLLMLPPIMFDAGFTLHKGYFFRSLFSILVFSIFGTLISTFIIGLGLWGYGSPAGMTIVHTLMFGALISAIDPVATLAIFHSLDVNHTIHMLVFGESVLNDAVSIVMYRTLESIEHSVDASSIIYAIFQFFTIITASILIGVIFALIAASLFRYSNLQAYPTLEMSLFVALMYFPYLTSETLEMSGIISLLFYGILTSHYTYFSLSINGQYIVTHFFHVLAFISETAVFLYLGFSVFIYHQKLNWTFTILGLIWCLIGRALNVFPLSYILNKVHSTVSVDISWKNQVILWFSGLRGAIAFVLCLNFPVAQTEVITTTLTIVLVSICVLGGGTVPLLQILQVEGANSAKSLEEEEALEFSKRGGIYHKFTEFDKHILLINILLKI